MAISNRRRWSLCFETRPTPLWFVGIVITCLTGTTYERRSSAVQAGAGSLLWDVLGPPCLTTIVRRPLAHEAHQSSPVHSCLRRSRVPGSLVDLCQLHHPKFSVCTKQGDFSLFLGWRGADPN